MRDDPYSMALYWALRSVRLRAKHHLTNADIAHLFGGEWELSSGERVNLLTAIWEAERAGKA